MSAGTEGAAEVGLLRIESVEEEGLKSRGKTLPLARAGAGGELAPWAMPTQAGSGTEEESARSGEARWRDFVKVVHPRPWEGPELPKTMRWEVSKSALVPSESPADFGSGLDEIGLLPGRRSATPEVSCSREMGDGDEASTEGPGRAGMEARRQRFRLFRYQEAKGPREAFEQLHDLCCQWLTPESCTKEQILELLILEQFLTVLPPEMQNWVREAIPDSCYQAVALAEEFLLRQQEAEGWEGRAFETSAKAAVDFSKADQVYSDRYRVVKQERGREARVPDGRDLAAEHDPARTELEVSSVDPDKPEDSAESPVENWENRSVADSWNDLSEITLHSPLEMGKKNANTARRTSQTQKLGLHRHQRINTGPNLHICTECGQSFTRKANLFRHQQLHTGQKLHLCTICGRSFTRRENLMRHLRIHAADNGWMTQNEEGKLWAPLEGMEVAELENQDGRTQQERCEAENWRDKSLEDEEGTCFEIAIPQKVCQGMRRSTCPVCGKSFTRKATLNRHQRIVHAGENLMCSDCGNRFAEPLLEHRTGNPETHRRKDLHQCVKCKEKNALNPSLIICESIHREKKLFKCLDCDRNFSCHSHLLRHQRIHTGEKPYLCLACGKSFRQTAHLVKHQRTHGNQAHFVW